MKFKTELHSHSSEVSQCAFISTADLVEAYIKKGYHSLVITNHYSIHSFEHLSDASWSEKNDLFLSAYKIAQEAAKGRINILLGMEYRNLYTANDYLVYGVTEEFIRTYSYDDEHNFLKMHLKDFVKLAHDNGMLVFQAHPFRNSMEIVNPSYLDGIEILNGHVRHDSRNDIAAMWAKKHNLLTCGGSDCHYAGEEATVVMLTDFPIENNEQLLDVLSGTPVIARPEDL